MAKLRRQNGFTLFEILVVVTTIALLVSLSIMSLGNIRKKVRDARRLTDVKAMYGALSMFYQQERRYPTSEEFVSGRSLKGPTSLRVYLKKIPTNPMPRNEGDCPDTDYIYRPTANFISYSLLYCLGTDIAGHNPGRKQATPAIVIQNCDTCF